MRNVAFDITVDSASPINLNNGQYAVVSFNSGTGEATVTITDGAGTPFFVSVADAEALITGVTYENIRKHQ